MHYARLDKDGKASQGMEDHLKGVANNVKEGFFPGINFEHFDSCIIGEVTEYMGYYHDLGKYTEYFQDYMLHKKESPYSDHAHISAIYLYQVLRQKYGITSFKDISNVLAFLVYTCVGQHHGNMNLAKYGDKSYYENALDKLLLQAENILEQTEIIFAESSIDKYVDPIFFKTCSRLEETLMAYKLNSMHQYIITRLTSERWYFLLIYMFSLLIDADKIDSAGANKKPVNLLPFDAVEKFLYKGRQTGKGINNRRATARVQVKNVLKSLSDEQIKENKFYSLTAPTGLGKTLLSLESALELQKRIGEIEGYSARIINAIPFINIVEQTSMVYRRVLGEQVNLIVHHRLAEFNGYDSVHGEDIPLDRALLEVEAWEGEVVLTTFVQLFHSILTGRNKALKKLNKLAGSIVILDEVQSIPEEYMPLMGAVLISIAKYYGVRFILMTATQPHLLQSGYRLLKEAARDNTSVELLADNTCYFNNMHRTELIPLIEHNMENDEFIELVLDKWKCTGSLLIVVNTIKRSIDIFNLLKKRLMGIIPEDKLGYLSTNIIPAERKTVIKHARKILNPEYENGKSQLSSEPYILVSTQTIEAGVDLDFDMAFRDVAPLESLVQAAGRVNRENLKGQYCPVYIIKFKNDSSNVYKLSDIQATTDFLKGYASIKEHEFQAIIEEYYANRAKRPLPDKSLDIWHEGIMKLDFDQVEKFELIENSGDIVDVFIEINDYAKKVADVYEEIIGSGEKVDIDKLQEILEAKHLFKDSENISIQERKALLRLIMAKMNNYIISIRQNRLCKNLPPRFTDRNGTKSTMLFVPNIQMDYYYDLKTGYKDESGMAYIF